MTRSQTLSWSGEVDLLSAPALQPRLQEAVSAAGTTEVVLDLAAVTFLDSTGLGVLVQARNTADIHGISLILRDTPRLIRRVLQVGGLDGHFTFDDSGPVGPVAASSLPPSAAESATPDPVFDQLAELTARLLKVPTALVSFVGRDGQVAPGAVGLAEPFQRTRSMDLCLSTCQFVVGRAAPLIKADLRQDPFLGNTEAVTAMGIVAYAGYPLVALDGKPVGSLCAADSEPHEWSQTDLANLRDLAAVGTALFQQRQTIRALQADRGDGGRE